MSENENLSYEGGYRSGVEDMTVIAAIANAKLEAALRAVLAEPHGCVFCDSGKLRNPKKDHDETCGFAMAEKALASLRGGMR